MPTLIHFVARFSAHRSLTMASLTLAALASAAGVASHVFWFRVGEHHMLATTYAQAFIASVVGGTFALVQLASFSITQAISTVALTTVAYLAGLYTSLIIYRLYFAPTARFPGPWQAKLTSLWFTAATPHEDCYYHLERLHNKYGKFVRIGSNDLSITDPRAVEPSFGNHAVACKGPWYDSSSPFDSMHTTRDKGLHDRRRRVWAPGFSDKALREYEEKVQVFNDKLVQRVKEHQGGKINWTRWANLYSFDVMGQLSFGKDYGMLDSGERHWALDLLTEGMSTAPPKPPIWMFRLLIAIPGLAGGFFKFPKFCSDELKWRVDRTGADKDITGWLLKAYKDWVHPETDPMFQADVRLIIVAGSDTTSATLTYLFYELAKRPEEVKKLREELRPLTNGEWSDKDIKNAPRLMGAINEALRMHPPVPSGLERQTPPEGMTIGETFIPGGVNYWVPMYPMSRGKLSPLNRCSRC